VREYGIREGDVLLTWDGDDLTPTHDVEEVARRLLDNNPDEREKPLADLLAVRVAMLIVLNWQGWRPPSAGQTARPRRRAATGALAPTTGPRMGG